MSSKIVKLENLKDQSVVILTSRDLSGFPLLTSLVLKYMQSEFKDTYILTNNRAKWESILSNYIQKGISKISFIELFGISSLSAINCTADLLVIDNASYSIDKFGSQETISLLLKARACLALFYKELQTESTLASIRSILPYFTSLDITEEQNIATTFYSRPPRLQKQIETYQISPSLQLTSQIFTASNKQPAVTHYKTPSSTFRLETNEEEEAVRTLLANPFLDSDNPVSQYVAGKGSSDSESDPDDDLNI